jgi:hypothetical protein
MKKNEEREESDEVERYEARTSAVAIKKEILWFARSKLLRSFPSRNFHPSRYRKSIPNWEVIMRPMIDE